MNMCVWGKAAYRWPQTTRNKSLAGGYKQNIPDGRESGVDSTEEAAATK